MKINLTRKHFFHMETFLGQSLFWLVLNQFGYKICNTSNFAKSLVLGLLLIEPTRLGQV